MKVLTSITIILAMPTIIFSFYGMNIGPDAAANGLFFANSIWFPLGLSLFAASVVAFILWKKKMF